MLAQRLCSKQYFTHRLYCKTATLLSEGSICDLNTSNTYKTKYKVRIEMFHNSYQNYVILK